MINHSMTTTTFELEGFKVVKNLGIVRGIIVRSRSVFGNIGAGFQMIFGGNITIYTQLCEQAREDSFIIGVRYDATEIATGVSEVLCYGTAVVVVPT